MNDPKICTESTLRDLVAEIQDLDKAMDMDQSQSPAVGQQEGSHE